MGNPFVEDLNDIFRGVRVRVKTSSHTYEGWGGRWNYSDQAFLVYDAEREDGERVGAVTITAPEAVERLDPLPPITEVRTDTVAPSPYSVRRTDDTDHQQFVKLTRERGHLLTYPTVRPVDASDHAYEIVAGHRRFHAARKAGLETIGVRIVELDDWEAVTWFVDEHIPVEGGDEQDMYSQQDIDRAISRLREEWPDDRLRELTPLIPYLRETLAATRREAIRHGHVTTG
ncbi:ParB/RepB/Spo0J family partition protein [Halocatena salina]|uniref:ParB N-terminal domain-containing protein n=1 Tax=Halocatena salina TaxID=2934340 RepID=A0A8U0A8P0_9EURY|nr:ParB N-terminal domain-containing protein [Halocatena salina]UPM44393.1 ParB N-terminal domain-containing protein [Halocatena salina]